MLERGSFILSSSPSPEEMDSLNEFVDLFALAPSFKKKYVNKSFLERIGLKKQKSKWQRFKSLMKNNAGRLGARAAGSLIGGTLAQKAEEKYKGKRYASTGFHGALTGGLIGDAIYSKMTGRKPLDVD